MSIDKIPIQEINMSEHSMEQLNKCLIQLNKPELMESFSAIILHSKELYHILQKFLQPNIESYIQERNILSKLPDELTKDLEIWISNTYTPSFDIHTPIKSFSVTSRRCFDIFIKILGELHFILASKKGNRTGEGFSQFVDFILRGDHLYFEKPISEILTDNINEIVILRFIRNNLKEDSFLTFDIQKFHTTFHITALLEYSRLDESLEKMVAENKIQISGNKLIFDVKLFLERIYKIILGLNEAIIDTLFKKVVLPSP